MADETEHPAVDSFANHILGDWNSVMDQFFARVDRKRDARGLSSAQVREALNRGYGYEVGDAWDEWMGGAL